MDLVFNVQPAHFFLRLRERQHRREARVEHLDDVPAELRFDRSGDLADFDVLRAFVKFAHHRPALVVPADFTGQETAFLARRLDRRFVADFARHGLVGGVAREAFDVVVPALRIGLQFLAQTFGLNLRFAPGVIEFFGRRVLQNDAVVLVKILARFTHAFEFEHLAHRGLSLSAMRQIARVQWRDQDMRGAKADRFLKQFRIGFEKRAQFMFVRIDVGGHEAAREQPLADHGVFVFGDGNAELGAHGFFHRHRRLGIAFDVDQIVGEIVFVELELRLDVLLGDDDFLFDGGLLDQDAMDQTLERFGSRRAHQFAHEFHAPNRPLIHFRDNFRNAFEAGILRLRGPRGQCGHEAENGA